MKTEYLWIFVNNEHLWRLKLKIIHGRRWISIDKKISLDYHKYLLIFMNSPFNNIIFQDLPEPLKTHFLNLFGNDLVLNIAR